MTRLFLWKCTIVFVLGLLTLLPLPSSATKVSTVVSIKWQGVPSSSVPLGVNVDLILRIQASEDTADVSAEVLPSDGFELVNGTGRWAGSMSRGQIIDLPVTVRFKANGEWMLGARQTTRYSYGDQASGAVLFATAADGTVELSEENPFIKKLKAAKTEEEFNRLGVGTPKHQ